MEKPTDEHGFHNTDKHGSEKKRIRKAGRLPKIFPAFLLSLFVFDP
jgi:hypothetical protein